MGQTRRDNKAEPSLELPSFPGLGRRKKVERIRREADEPTQALQEPTQDEYGERTLALQADPAAASNGVTDPSLQDRAPETAPADAPRRRAKKERPEKELPETERPQKAGRKKTEESRSTPLLPGPVAAGLTGLVVGAAGAAGTYGAIAGCKAVRGVSSCGGGPGFFILVAIVVLMVLLGTGLLRLLKVGDPGSTSFLAVGLVAVISMLVLLDVIFAPAMFVVIPVLSALAFLLAHWVTTRFEDDKGRRDWT